jgi:hypothetical protein
MCFQRFHLNIIYNIIGNVVVIITCLKQKVIDVHFCIRMTNILYILQCLYLKFTIHVFFVWWVKKIILFIVILIIVHTAYMYV